MHLPLFALCTRINPKHGNEKKGCKNIVNVQLTLAGLHISDSYVYQRISNVMKYGTYICCIVNNYRKMEKN